MKSHENLPKSIKDAFVIFSRNGKWGTCSGCPRDSNHHAYPEFCQEKNRGDHLLTLKDLTETYNNYCFAKEKIMTLDLGENHS